MIRLLEDALGFAFMAAVITPGLAIIAFVIGIALAQGFEDEDQNRILRRVFATVGVVAVVCATYRFSRDSFGSVSLGLSGLILIVAACVNRRWL